METKKTPRADLESKKRVFFLIGLVFALGAILVSFEWTSKPAKAKSLGNVTATDFTEELVQLIREPELNPPPPPPKEIEIINIVDNETKTDEFLPFFDTGADERTLIDVVPFVTTKEETVEESDTIFVVVENKPEFPGGEMALRAYLANAVNYPAIAQENEIQGKVYVTFVIGKDGLVKNAVVARGVDAALDKEALRVVNSLPKWKPGKQRGVPVNVSFTVPINFVLQ